MARSSSLYRLFVGIDVAATTCAVSWMRPNPQPTRAITIKQTPAGFADLQRQIQAIEMDPHAVLIVMEATPTDWMRLATSLIGASFGPIVGAMVVDYLLSGGNWSGPRAGFNPAGWIAWLLGFIVGILPNQLLPASVRVDVPCAPVAAFVVGAVVYFVCAKMGMLSPVIPLPAKSAPAKPMATAA